MRRCKRRCFAARARLQRARFDGSATTSASTMNEGNCFACSCLAYLGMVNICVEYTGDLHCDAVHGPSHSKIATDAPADNKGKGESFSPTDLVATALGTCISTTMGLKADQHRCRLERDDRLECKRKCRRRRRVGLSGCRRRFTFLCRQIHRIAKRSNRRRSIARCTKVFRPRSIGRQSSSGKAESRLLRECPESRSGKQSRRISLVCFR